MFSLHFVKGGVLDKRYIDMLSDALEVRENSDYDVYFESTESEARTILNNAKEFIKKIKEILIKEKLLNKV